MTQDGDKLLTQLDGPFIRRAKVSRLNMDILLMLAASVAAAAANTGLLSLCTLPLTLLSAALGCALSNYQTPHKSLSSLDWAVSSVIAWLFVYCQGLGNIFLSMAFLGFFCGILSSVKKLHKIVHMAGLVPLLSAGLLFCILIFIQNWLHNTSDVILVWRMKAWPELFTITLSGFILTSSAKSSWRFAAPWIMLMSSYFLMRIFMPEQITLLEQVCAELSSLILIAFFIVPQLCHNYLEKIYCAATLILLWVFYPYSALNGYSGHNSYMAAYYALLLFLPVVMLQSKRKKNFYNTYKKSVNKTNKDNNSSMRAVIRCGHNGKAPLLANYKGFRSCRIASEQGGGVIKCPYGCLSFHDCIRACPYKAIKADGHCFPFIDSLLCVGCGLCISTCPKELLTLIPRSNQAFVPCSALDNLKINASYCPTACIACGRCRKACPASAIDRPDPLKGAMIIDQHACLAYDCELECIHACPQGIIKAQK